MTHDLPRRAKVETYSALTHYREINIPAKPLANANVHRLIKPGTCCENDIDETRVCCFDALLIFREQNSRLDVIDQ